MIRIVFALFLLIALVSSAVVAGYSLDHPDMTSYRVMIDSFPLSVLAPVAFFICAAMWEWMGEEE